MQGRTVLNPSGKNLSATFRKLEGILARNQVRKQLRMTERHEKKGVKRRRLSSERWRKRFADEVRLVVSIYSFISLTACSTPISGAEKGPTRH